MAKVISTSIRIHASAETVWQVVTDTARYPEWNPFITRLEGELKVGNRIKVKIQKMTFKPVILVCDSARELRWLGSLGIKGIFDGEHAFLITDQGDGSVVFEQREKFTGLLTSLFSGMLEKDTLPGFRQMNEKLKDQAESMYNITTNPA
ncbi:SRPBCC family protein [Roseivirga sp. BDSF3-8]|uniref:SRPBCC family protein n=1 Tax=Roseivirga sp. BDSF3-8 TaxID=3241598 RepID=UPI003531BBC4